MRETDFQHPTTPGRLEPTIFKERVFASPGLEFMDVKGLGYVPQPLPANFDWRGSLVDVHPNLMAAERTLSQLEGMSGRLSNPTMLMNLFARKEARHSSAIENTFASEEQLALFKFDESAVEADKRPEVHEVNNYLKALYYGHRDERPVCLNLIKEMHAILLEDSTRTTGRPGEFRTTQNAIGDPTRRFKDARFVPPPPRYLPELLADLEAFLNADDGMPRLVRFALTHYQFECIHPFDDGNGRLGRLLVALQLCKQGQLGLPFVYVSGFLESHRDDYYALLYRTSSSGAWVDWINFFLSAISTQARDALTRAELLDALRVDFHSRVQKKRASAMLPRLVDELFVHPAMTVASAAATAGMKPNSAGRLVATLEDAGIIKEATGRKHYRVFVAPAIMAAMNSPLEELTSQQP